MNTQLPTFSKGIYKIDYNLKQKLNSYLTWCKSTGFYRLFQEEKLLLDEVTAGYITILDNDPKGLPPHKAKKLNELIRKKVLTPDCFDVFIGPYCFEN